MALRFIRLICIINGQLPGVHMPKLSPNSLELMQMHVNVLFTHDRHMRFTGLNQWNGGPAPRFYLGRTPMGHVWRFRADVPDNLTEQLVALCRQETGNILREPQHKDRYIQLLSSQAEIKQVWHGPAYWRSGALIAAVPPTPINGANAHLLRGGLEDWRPDVPHCQPFMAAVMDNRAVSVCASVRTSDIAHEAGVETLAAFRRQGHAANAVAGWANALLEKQIVPLYSTSWENRASQGVANRVGFSLYGTDFHIA